MNFDEMRELIEATVRQQSQLTDTLVKLVDIQAADAVRVGRLEGVVTTLTKTVEVLASVVQVQSERMDSSDARLDRLTDTVDRYIKARGNGGNGSA